MKYSTRWIKHCRTQEQKQEVIRNLRAARPVIDQLKKLLEADLMAHKRKAYGLDSYENPSWGYLQADFIGYERAISTVLKLLNINLDGEK